MEIKDVLKNIRLKINKLGAKKRKNKLKSTDFSIISNNCYAGIIYQYLGLEYNTPTVGTFIYAEDYIKLLKNFDYYINKELKFINYNESKYKDELQRANIEKAIIGILDDVEIVFLHYSTEKEALEKWKRRCQRLSKNLIFKFNDQNLCNYEHLKEFECLKEKNKICFTAQNYPEFKSTIQLKKYRKYKEIKEDYYSGHRYFNIIEYINSIS